MEQTKIISKPIAVRIISPSGIIYHSYEELLPPVDIQSIIAHGVLQIAGQFNNISGEAAYDFEILPDHNPLVAKIAPKSHITLFGTFEKGSELKFYTENGGIITINFDDKYTLVLFTLQDVQKVSDKK